VIDSLPLTRLITLAAIFAVVAVCASSGLAGPAPPHAILVNASGDLQVTNSREGQAILQTNGLAPGQSVSGTVELANAGALAGDLGLTQVELQEQPGANGGLLSNAIQLEVADVTGGDSIPVFAGALNGLGDRGVGSLGPGKVRRFRFTASLPDTGRPPGPTSGDNVYAGSGITVRYAWTATATDAGSGTQGGGTPGGGGAVGGSEISHVRPSMRFRVDIRRLLRRGWIDVFATCNRGCTLVVSAKAPRQTRVKIRERTATLPLPGKTGRIRMKLSKRNRTALLRALRHRKRVVLQVNVRLVAAGWGPTPTYRKRVSVRPAKR
jgi:hypothetical protein